ncbi:MAG TPA: VCBS repeat-containing protein, partial [Flavobacteriales bacterium]|nr:VCBS repeat-containing protein [Flavobacteriales bacterium]
MRNLRSIVVFGLLGSGTVLAQFAAPVVLSSAVGDPALRAADADGDTDTDLIGLFDGMHFRGYVNADGNGSFSTLTNWTDAAEPIDRWAMADMDGDALVDIVFTVQASPDVWWMKNQGASVFGAPAFVGSLPNTPLAMQLADITGEGFREIIFSIHEPGGDIFWFANAGSGFSGLVQAAVDLPSPPNSLLLVGDIDGIGGNDLIVGAMDHSTYAVRNMLGDASAWQMDQVLDGGNVDYAGPTKLMDVDNDGDLDLAEVRSFTVHWAENHLDEGGVMSPFTEHMLEEWEVAGPGSFANMGCNEKAGVVFVSANPMVPVSWAAWVNELNDFAYRTEVVGVDRGTDPLLADLNNDGRDDLVLNSDVGVLVYFNALLPAVTEAVLPQLHPLCMYGDPFPLPDASPLGGHWSGARVYNDVLDRGSLPGTGSYAMGYAAYETAGCPFGAAADLFVAIEPTITPNIGGVLCSGGGPIQLASVPPATSWIGATNEGLFYPDAFSGGVVIAIVEDVTGTICAAETQPIEVWTSLPAEIAASGPFCINSGMQLIQAASAPPFGAVWSGDILGWNSSGASFDPSAGAGDYMIILDVEAIGPYQCPGV